MTIRTCFAAVVRGAIVALFIALLGTTVSAQITPSADAYTNSASPATNYGAGTLLYVNGATEASYIQFNLSPIPSGATVQKAILKLYVNTVVTAGSFNVDYVNGTWAEKTITYNLSPALGTTIASGVALTAASKNQFVLIDMTPVVQAWLSGSQPNDGIALVANSTFNATFDSKENTGTSHPPELDIVFAEGLGTITGVTTGSTSGLTGGGTSGTLGLSLLTSCTSGQVLSWSGSAWICTKLSGGGTITGVTAGSDLTGGGTTGKVTLNLDTSKVPLLSAANNFSGNQSITGNGTYSLSVFGGSTAAIYAAGNTTGSTYGVYGNGTIAGVTGNSAAYGLYGIGGTYGVYATGAVGGVVGVAGSAGGYGVYGGAGSGSYAGYFQGPVAVTGVISGNGSGLTNLPVTYSSFVPTCNLAVAGALSTTPANLGTIGTFTKAHASSNIVIDWGGHVSAGTDSNVVQFYLEVDGNLPLGGQPTGLLFTQNAGANFFLPMHAVFTGLSTGSHNVQIWVSIPNGSASNVRENPGCYNESVVIEEM